MTELKRNGPYWALTALVVAWLGLVVLAPFGAERGWLASPFIYMFFDLVCHQQAERSFHLGEHAFAVCHRCFGLYLGFFLGLLAMPSLPRVRRLLWQHPRAIVVFFVPMLIDVFFITNTMTTRLTTGMLASAPVALFGIVAVQQLLDSDSLFIPEGHTRGEP